MDSRFFMLERENREMIFKNSPSSSDFLFIKSLPLHNFDLKNHLLKNRNDQNKKNGLYLSTSDVIGFSKILLPLQGNSKIKPSNDTDTNGSEPPLFNQREFYSSIESQYTSDSNIYKSKTLNDLLSLKWNVYGRHILVKDLLYNVFVTAIFGLFTMVAATRSPPLWLGGGLLGLGVALIFLELFYELREVNKTNILNYFRHDKNWIDIFAIISYIFLTIVTINCFSISMSGESLETYPEWLNLFLVSRSISNFSLYLRILWTFQVSLEFGFISFLYVLSIIISRAIVIVGLNLQINLSKRILLRIKKYDISFRCRVSMPSDDSSCISTLFFAPSC